MCFHKYLAIGAMGLMFSCSSGDKNTTKDTTAKWPSEGEALTPAAINSFDSVGNNSFFGLCRTGKLMAGFRFERTDAPRRHGKPMFEASRWIKDGFASGELARMPKGARMQYIYPANESLADAFSKECATDTTVTATLSLDGQTGLEKDICGHYDYMAATDTVGAVANFKPLTSLLHVSDITFTGVAGTAAAEEGEKATISIGGVGFRPQASVEMGKDGGMKFSTPGEDGSITLAGEFAVRSTGADQFALDDDIAVAIFPDSLKSLVVTAAIGGASYNFVKDNCSFKAGESYEIGMGDASSAGGSRESLKLSIQVSSGESFQPFHAAGDEGNLTLAGYNVEWGDGVSTVIPQGTYGKDDHRLRHSYKKGGKYSVTVTALTSAQFDQPKLSRTADGGMVVSIDGTLPRWASAKDLFADFKNLQRISTDAFARYGKVTDFSGCFEGCLKLTQLPGELFRRCKSAGTFARAFRGCNALTVVPGTLFSSCTEALDFSYCFQRLPSLTMIPTALFKNNAKATTFTGCFMDCTALTSIPSDLFRHNTEAQLFSYCFHGCSNIAQIPSDLFGYALKAARFNHAFYGCSALRALPSRLFERNLFAYDYTNCFAGCSRARLVKDVFGADDIPTRFKACKTLKVKGCFSACRGQGMVPALWQLDGQPVKTDHDDCFRGVSPELANYDDIPENWR